VFDIKKNRKCAKAPYGGKPKLSSMKVDYLLVFYGGRRTLCCSQRPKAVSV